MQAIEIKQHFLKHYPHAQIEVVDLTHTNNHYQMNLSCKELEALPRVTAHRKVMGLFKEQFASGEIHALTIHFHSK